MQESKEAHLEFKDILGIGMTLVVTVIGLSLGADVTSDMRADQAVSACASETYLTSYNSTSGLCYNSTATGTPGSLAYNISGNGLSGIQKLSVKLPTIMTVMVIAIIIGVLVRHLYVSYKG